VDSETGAKQLPDRRLVVHYQKGNAPTGGHSAASS
jgi:hypothetical protein